MDDDRDDVAAVLAAILEDGPQWVKDCLDRMAAAGFSKDQAETRQGEAARPLSEGRQTWRR